MANSFSELIQRLLTHQTMVTIGSGEHELQGTITSFDTTHHVMVFVDQIDNMKFFIPLTSIRSISVDEADGGFAVFLDLFKK